MDRVRGEAQQRSVRRLAEEIEGLVQRRIGGQIRGLHVEVYQDWVVITGRASTYYAESSGPFRTQRRQFSPFWRVPLSGESPWYTSRFAATLDATRTNARFRMSLMC